MEAIDKIEALYDEIQDKIGEIRELMQHNYPDRHNVLEAYDGYQFMSSGNRYDQTLNKAIEAIREGDDV